jgi:NAD(P)-dependent dehydrogenase (short-subunit alcohol dehydrogenase family)
MINMGRVLALEWGPQNIRVNAVCPNFVITPLTEPLFAANPGFTEDVMRRTPIGRLPTPEEIAAAVVYLASPGAAAVTGQTLTVDGGWTAH